jgi:hypothetical protein
VTAGVGSGPTVGAAGAGERLGTADDSPLGATVPATVVGPAEAGTGDGESSGLVQPVRTTPATRRASGMVGSGVGFIARTQTLAGHRV